MNRPHTKRVRIILMPERVSGKSGNRDYGKERLHPITTGWRSKPNRAEAERRAAAVPA